MNRRNFFKTTTLGLGTVMLAPTTVLGVTDDVPPYKQFDWLPTPRSLLYRIEVYKNGDKVINCVFVAVKTLKLKLISDVNDDYTQDQFVGNNDKGISPDLKYNQKYYTNELLLNEAKKAGLTHIYQFDKSTTVVDPYGKEYVFYLVRGVTMPDWKTVDGKLRVVEVDGLPHEAMIHCQP